MASRLRPRHLLLQRGAFDDLDHVMPVMEAAFDPCFGEAWSRSQCGGILPMRGVELWLAKVSDDITQGFALWRTIADECELLLLGVEPASQGHGVGTALLKHFLDRARHGGARRLHLEVRDGNVAVGLYEKAGFRLAGRRRDYYRGCAEERHDALTYSLYID